MCEPLLPNNKEHCLTQKITYVSDIALYGVTEKLPCGNNDWPQDHQAGRYPTECREDETVGFQRPTGVAAEEVQVSE